jgi:VIT1/CCC1 family predicted Fe2+/Mn2+ transporter
VLVLRQKFINNFKYEVKTMTPYPEDSRKIATLTSLPWYKSKTVLSGIVAVLAGLAGAFGYAIAPEDQEAIIEVITIAGATVGGVGAIYGRIVATKVVK